MDPPIRKQLHFVLMPLMSPGHLIPMADMAKLLAQHGVTVSIVTTPLNAVRFKSTIDRAVESGLQIQLVTLPFPSVEAGLPDSCENMDKLPSRALIKNFFIAATLLRHPFEQLLENLQPPPSCIISGKNLPWTIETARKFNIPRIFFDGMGCFSFSCSHKLEITKIHESHLKSDPFVLPGLPHRVEITKEKLPENFNPGSSDLSDFRLNMKAAEIESDGIIVNTFEELEAEYVKEYRNVKSRNVWCIGPVSVCNKTKKDKYERGNTASINETECLKWLDLWENGSVIYASLGSISGLKSFQLKELGLGLEASKKPFIWVIRESENTESLRKWVFGKNFQERTKERSFIIWGWAPQVLILAHKAIGGFLTHCGWNSVVEGVAAGVPMVTCPLFSEQFLNEKLVVEVLKIGVSVGIEAAVIWGLEEKAGLVIKSEEVKKGIERLMDEGEEGEERKRRAMEFGEIARRAVVEGGSSYFGMEMLIQFVLHRNKSK